MFTTGAGVIFDDRRRLIVPLWAAFESNVFLAQGSAFLITFFVAGLCCAAWRPYAHGVARKKIEKMI